MAMPRRMAVNGDKQRELLVDAAEALLLEDGYPALTARRVTQRCGMKSQLIYYYFQTMDDVVLALLARINTRRETRFEEAVRAANPLAALWALNSDPEGAVLSAEMTALAVRRESLRSAMVRSATAFRARQVAALDAILGARCQTLGFNLAKAVVMTASALARTSVSERAIGVTDCHADAAEMVEWLISLAGEPPAADPAYGA